MKKNISNSIASIEEFEKTYWNYYLSLEKEFLSTENFLAIDKNNKNAYSIAYMKLLLEIGSEIDVLSKQICSMIDCNFNSKEADMQIYCKTIELRLPKFKDDMVFIRQEPISPWRKLFKSYKTKKGSYSWWQIYNGVKHNRNACEYGNLPTYKIANQQNILFALGALFQLEMYCLREIIKSYQLDNQICQLQPIVSSSLFKLKSMSLFFDRQTYSEYLFDDIRIRMI